MKEYSGRFVVRLHKPLHEKLAQIAERDEISLNQLVATVLAEWVGREAFVSPKRKRKVPSRPRTKLKILKSRVHTQEK